MNNFQGKQSREITEIMCHFLINLKALQLIIVFGVSGVETGMRIIPAVNVTVLVVSPGEFCSLHPFRTNGKKEESFLCSALFGCKKILISKLILFLSPPTIS